MISTVMRNLLAIILKSKEVRKLVALAFLLLVVLLFPLILKFVGDYQKANTDKYWNAQNEIKF